MIVCIVVEFVVNRYGYMGLCIMTEYVYVHSWKILDIDEHFRDIGIAKRETCD